MKAGLSWCELGAYLLLRCRYLLHLQRYEFVHPAPLFPLALILDQDLCLSLQKVCVPLSAVLCIPWMRVEIQCRWCHANSDSPYGKQACTATICQLVSSSHLCIQSI